MTAQLGPYGPARCGSYSYGGKAVAKPWSGPQAQAPPSTPGGKLLDVLVTGKCTPQ